MQFFRHKVLRMLLARDKITPERVQLLLTWKHSGFAVHRGRQLQPPDTQGQETVAAYPLHAPVSQQPMSDDPASGTVRYDTLSQPAAGSFSVHEAGPESQQTFTALDPAGRPDQSYPEQGRADPALLWFLQQ